jgi:hypothetical protein
MCYLRKPSHLMITMLSCNRQLDCDDSNNLNSMIISVEHDCNKGWSLEPDKEDWSCTKKRLQSLTLIIEYVCALPKTIVQCFHLILHFENMHTNICITSNVSSQHGRFRTQTINQSDSKVVGRLHLFVYSSIKSSSCLYEVVVDYYTERDAVNVYQHVNDRGMEYVQ